MGRSALGGFTLLELVIITVILGTLVAVALPRFIELETEARVAKLEGLKGAITSAAALARSECATTPECDPAATPPGRTDRRICLEANCSPGDYVLLHNGYPTDRDTGIVRMLNVDGFYITGDNPISFSAGDGFELNCRVRYQRAPAPSEAPDIQLKTNGC